MAIVEKGRETSDEIFSRVRAARDEPWIGSSRLAYVRLVDSDSERASLIDQWVGPLTFSSLTMVELRKRKAPTQPAAAEKKSKSAPTPSEVDTTSQAPSQKVPKVDDILDLENFGGEIETNDGSKTTLKKLVEGNTSGVVLFTYPKASTPGCTSVLHHLGGLILSS